MQIGHSFQYLLMIVVVLAAATAVRFYFVSWLGERTVADIRQAVQQNLLRLAPGFFEENRPSEIASRMTSGQPMTSIGFELVVISACVLGGVSMKGGIGKISYIIAGVLILGLMENAMNLLNISPFAQYVVRGLILLAAVLFDRYKQVRKARV